MKKASSIIILLLFASSMIGNTSIQTDSISKIQICLILDVSGSMNGLLNQAQNEIWKTISFLEQFKKDSLETAIEIAVVSYGNKGYAENGHVKLVTDFSEDIDKIAEDLWLMERGGEDEFCGFAIKKSLDSLSWEDKKIFKCIIMAGNEPFDQGELNFEVSIKLAIEKGILLNTIYCGEGEKGIDEKWKNASTIGNGSYANIDQEIKIDEFKTPYDNTLIQFYDDYKSTYFEEESKEKKIKRFDSEGELSPAFRDMIIYKFGSMKRDKDIIDKFNDSNWEMDEFEESEIPKKWQNLDKRALRFKLLKYARKRNISIEGFEKYTKKVDDFLRITIQPKLKSKTLNLAMGEIMKAQLLEFGYEEKKE